MMMKQKNSALKCLKWHSSTVRSMKKGCSVDGGQGICPLFSSPPLGIWELKGPHPREFAIQGKKNANGGQPGGGGAGGREVVWGLGAAGIDWCINTGMITERRLQDLSLTHFSPSGVKFPL